MKIFTNLRPDLKAISKRRWYKQGGAIWMFYGFSAYLSMNETLGYDGNIFFQRGDHNTAFFDRDKEYNKTLRVIRRQKKDRHFIDRQIARWYKKLNHFLITCERRFSKPIQKWSDTDLVSFFKWHERAVCNHWKAAVVIEWSDPDGEKILQDEMRFYDCQIAPKELAALIAPKKLSFVQREMRDRYALVCRYLAGKKVDAAILQHQKKYYWLKNNWAYVYELTPGYFKRQIVASSRRPSILQAEVNKAKRLLQSNAQVRRRIYATKNMPSELKNVLYMFQRMADWRDERKKLSTNLSNAYLHAILKRLAKVNDVSQQLVGVATPGDIKSWRLSPQTKRELRKRLKFGAFFCKHNKKCSWLYGAEAKRLFALMNSGVGGKRIQGTVANKGLITGYARIIETKADFRKFRKGDIIVAHMTRPEYVPLLKCAKAIITDEGGLTCHAAIISRELNIPCIIGTQTATSALKDGDRIEVDANRGIVKKI